MRQVFVYILWDPRNNGKCYVGITLDLRKRFLEHLGDFKSEKRTKKINWIKSLKKLSLEPILESVDIVDENVWQFWERHYISLYRSWGFDLLNGTHGGDGTLGIKQSSETILKRVEKLKGQKRTTEAKEKMRIARLGKTLTKQEKDIRKAKLSKYPNPRLGKRQSAETLSKKSLALKGRKRKPEDILKKALASRKPIVQLDKKGIPIREWNSVKEAGEELKIWRSCISDCLKGNTHTAGGFKWNYKN